MHPLRALHYYQTFSEFQVFHHYPSISTFDLHPIQKKEQTNLHASFSKPLFNTWKQPQSFKWVSLMLSWFTPALPWEIMSNLIWWIHQSILIFITLALCASLYQAMHYLIMHMQPYSSPMCLLNLIIHHSMCLLNLCCTWEATLKYLTPQSMGKGLIFIHSFQLMA